MTRQESTEVLVIGAGPAGIAAASAAAERGLGVIVLDDNPRAGGQIWRESTVEASPLRKRVDKPREQALARFHRSGAQLLNGRSVFDADARGIVRTIRETPAGAVQEQFQFKQLVLATGARERFLPGLVLFCSRLPLIWRRMEPSSATYWNKRRLAGLQRSPGRYWLILANSCRAFSIAPRCGERRTCRVVGWSRQLRLRTANA